MSDCQSGASQREDPPSPTISDEKMDTASESFPSSQHTPNTPSENEALDLAHGQSSIDHFDNPPDFVTNVAKSNAFVTNTAKSNTFVTNGTKSFVTNSTKDNGFARNIKENSHITNIARDTFVANSVLDNSVDNSYVANGATDNAFITNGSKKSAAVPNTGVLRLANPPDCLNDNDNFHHSESFEEALTTETISLYYEDTSDRQFPKKSTEVPKELDNAHKIDKFQSNENLDNFTNNRRFSTSENGDDRSCSQPVEPEVEDFHQPLRLGTNPPRFTSTLTLTDDHPLMGLSSPESPPSVGNYPDLILPSRRSVRDDCRNTRSNTNDSNFLNSECSGVLSMSSTEEESFNRSLLNGELSIHSEGFCNQEGPQRNTSKNNLYFSDNFTSSDGNRSADGSTSDDHKSYFVDGKLSASKNSCGRQPDILDSNKKCSNESFDKSNKEYERKKLKPDVKAPKVRSTVVPKMNPEVASGRVLGRDLPSTILERRLASEQDPERKVIELNFDVSTPVHVYASQVADFPKSPSELRTSLSFELPVETPSNFFPEDEAISPDSSSSRASRSLYLAEVDAVGGRVSLRPRGSQTHHHARRRIRPLLTETDTESCGAAAAQETSLSSASSMDSLSLHSEQDAGPCQSPAVAYYPGRPASDEDGGEPEPIPEYSLSEERHDSRSWLKVTLPAGEQRTIDMKVIEPYKRVLSHGGYAQSGRRDAIVVFSACFLPDSSRVDYNYVMDNLFLYVLTTLEQLVTDDYILIYLHGSAAKRSMPTFHWLKKCYQLIDRRLRKSLKHLYLVHPTFWLKSIMWMTRPFISWKFSRKLSYVQSLEELAVLVPVEPAAIPERV